MYHWPFFFIIYNPQFFIFDVVSHLLFYFLFIRLALAGVDEDT